MIRTSKYSAEQNARMEVAALSALIEGARAMTRDEVIAVSVELSGVTPQKLSRVLGELCEKGVASKTKTSNGRVAYEAV